MSRCPQASLAAAVLVATAGLVPIPAPAMGQRPDRAADARPNVVLILADDLGWGDLGGHGSAEIPTPNIDRLAREGVLCRDGYATAPQCLPSRAALMTGRYAQRFGFELNASRAKGDLPREERTLAESLSAAGYRTGLFGKWNLGESEGHFPQDRGYEEFFGFLSFAHRYVGNDRFRADRADTLRRGREPVLESEHLSVAIAREAAAFIADHGDRPFFLTVSFNAPHTPIQPRAIHRQRFASLPDSTRAAYAGLVLSLDEGTGRVLRELRAQGLEDRTLVFFVGDNGGDLRHRASNGPLRGGKNSLWEGGIRVPWIARWPGHFRGGAIDRQPVTHLDVVPTVLSAVGVALPTGLDGRDRAPRWSGRGDEGPADVLAWRFFGGEAMPATRSWALREGAWKLSSSYAGGQDELWLTNLEADIAESDNLVAAHPEIVARLRALWDAWNEQLPPPAGPDRGSSAEAE